MLSLLFLGFLIGMRHAMEADHLAAVATLVSKNHSLKQAIKLGSLWGLGHTITLFLFGSLVLLTDLFIPEIAANWLEFFVGAMLVALGLDLLRRLYKERIHFHFHRHQSNEIHFHAHSHKNATGDKNFDHASPSSHQHQHIDLNKLSWRALFVGVLHGMAGSAALILLTLETIDSPLEGLAYIALFGVGSIIGMGILSYIISIPLRASEKGMTWMHNGLQMMIGGATVFLGGYILLDNATSIGLV